MDFINNIIASLLSRWSNPGYSDGYETASARLRYQLHAVWFRPVDAISALKYLKESMPRDWTIKASVDKALKLDWAKLSKDKDIAKTLTGIEDKATSIIAYYIAATLFKSYWENKHHWASVDAHVNKDLDKYLNTDIATLYETLTGNRQALKRSFSHTIVWASRLIAVLQKSAYAVEQIHLKILKGSTPVTLFDHVGGGFWRESATLLYETTSYLQERTSVSENLPLFGCTFCGGNYLKKMVSKIPAGQYLCVLCESQAGQCEGCGDFATLGGGTHLCTQCIAENEEAVSPLIGYHSHMGRKFLVPDSRFNVGIELEKEDPELRMKIKPRQLLYKTGWVAERDASLSQSCGFEMVSPILPLDKKHEDALLANLESVKEFVEAKVKKNCGGHIHVSDKLRKPKDLLLDIQGYLPLLYSMYPARSENSYSSAKNIHYVLAASTNHHDAITVGNTGVTVEIRLFPSPKSMFSLKFRLKLIKIMLENPRYSINEVISDITGKKALYKLMRTVYTEEEIAEKMSICVNMAKDYGAVSPLYKNKKLDNFKKKIKSPTQRSKEALEEEGEDEGLSSKFKREVARVAVPQERPVIGEVGEVTVVDSDDGDTFIFSESSAPF